MGLDDRFEMRLESDMREAIDAWRNRQPVPPSMAAAIRYILKVGLEHLDDERPPKRVRR
jgi:hypothetical protein